MMTNVRTVTLFSLLATASPAFTQTPAIDLANVVPTVRTDGVTEVLIRTIGAWTMTSISINGRGPFEVLIDTGSTTTALDVSVATALGLAGRGRREVVSLTGVSRVPLVTIDRLAIDGAGVTGLQVLLQDLQSIRAPYDRNLVGILGQDVLAAFDVLIDYQRRTLILESQSGRLRERLRGNALRVRLAEGRPMIEAVAGRTAPMDLVLDSASDSVIVFADVLAGRTEAISENEPRLQVLSTASGKRLARSGRVDRLAFGKTRIDDVAAVIHDAEMRNGRLEDGVVPTSLFDRVFVSVREGVALLNPRRMPAPEARSMRVR